MSELSQNLKIVLGGTNMCYVSEGCLGPWQTSMMELFRQNSKWLLSANYFRKKSPSEMFVSFLHTNLRGMYIPYLV